MILFSKFMTKFHISSFINKNKYTCNKLKHLKGPAFFSSILLYIVFIIYFEHNISIGILYTFEKTHRPNKSEKSYVNKNSIDDQ